jgi:hypothetical protein
VAGADPVQENGPEDLDLKRELFGRIGAAALAEPRHGPALGRPRPDLDPETVQAISDATEHAYDDRGYPELAEERDRREIAVLSALASEGARP